MEHVTGLVLKRQVQSTVCTLVQTISVLQQQLNTSCIRFRALAQDQEEKTLSVQLCW